MHVPTWIICILYNYYYYVKNYTDTDNKLRKYEGTVVLGFSILVVIAVTSFLPRAVATITLVLLVVVFLLIWKRVKRELYITSAMSLQGVCTVKPTLCFECCLGIIIC